MARVHATLAALTAFGLALAVPASGVVAQSAPATVQNAAPEGAKKPAPAKKKVAAPAGEAKQAAADKPDPAAIQKSLEAAQKSLDGGKFDLAVGQANTIMGQKGLEARAMARALVIRGVGFKKQGKPAQAMSDLQSALHLKNGLNDSERAAANQALAESYREAGLSVPAAIAAPTRTAAPVATNVQTASTARAPEPKPPSSAPGGNFFSSLFGGGGSPAPVPPKPQVAASVPVAAPPAPVVSEAPPVKAASKTPPARATVAQAAQAAVPTSAPTAPQPVVAAPGAGGRFRLLLEGARSRQEAQSVLERVKKEHPSEIAGRGFEIEETAFGNMGTFYRVRIGPYGDGKEPAALCATLRSKGIDCRVPTQ